MHHPNFLTAFLCTASIQRMIGIVVSRQDPASMHVADALRAGWSWRPERDLYVREKKVLYYIDDTHLYHDDVDVELRERGVSPDVIVFPSRHASKARRRTLSVHPIGNWGAARFGGTRRQLVPSCPHLMLGALKYLQAHAVEGYEVCYEATHHGPFLNTPCFFIETGSTEREWHDPAACEVIAETIMHLMTVSPDTVAVGIGGGHYTPRFTDIALCENVAFGHVAPRYAIDDIDEIMLKRMIAATPGCSHAYIHGRYPTLERMLEEHGMVRAGDGAFYALPRTNKGSR
jgi:D-aminoacyl-tRNA deacylase